MCLLCLALSIIKYAAVSAHDYWPETKGGKGENGGQHVLRHEETACLMTCEPTYLAFSLHIHRDSLLYVKGNDSSMYY